MFRQVFANQFIPDSSLEQLRAFDDIQRQTIQPEGAARLMASFNEVDVSELARQVTCPTLVLHSREDARIPFEEGRRVASAIRAAEFVPLDSRNHILLDHQSAWTQCFDEIDAFMRRHGETTSITSSASSACPIARGSSSWRAKRALDEASDVPNAGPQKRPIVRHSDRPEMHRYPAFLGPSEQSLRRSRQRLLS